MANNIVAFIGYDSFDIILYLSRILQKLGRKVLIADYSGTSALSYSVPRVEGIDTYQDIITYRGVDFTRMIINNDISEHYDEILIDCGFNEPNLNLSLLTKVIYVSSMLKYNLERLSYIKSCDEIEVKKSILIREAVELKISVDTIAAIIKKTIPEYDIDILYREDIDYENSLICHFNQSIRFIKISGRMKAYLFKEIKQLCAIHTDKQIRSAYKKARKGE